MTLIDKADLRAIDLNLLVAFEALMQTRSVTRAAERLRLGQPATSHALKRLRELLGDPLFVRTAAGMAPTPRALALDEPIRAILASIETALFASPSFDPPRENRIFRVGALDYAQAVIADALLRRLQTAAPGCRLILVAADCDSAGRALERGEIDLAIGAFPNLVAAGHRRLLYQERYACVYDAKACGVGSPITRAEWLDLPHIVMSTRADYCGPLDEILRAAGEARTVVASTPNFLAIPHLLKGKRLVAALPSRLARICEVQLGLTSCRMPIDAPPFDVVMVWNVRTESEPGAEWLRRQILQACAALDEAGATAPGPPAAARSAELA